MAYEPTAKEKKAIELVNKRFELSEKYTRPYFDRFLDNYKHYFLHTIASNESKDTNPDYPFFFDVELPISYQVVETILPRMLGRPPEFTVKARNPQADSWLEPVYTPLIKFQWDHPELKQRPMFARLGDNLKEEFITGNTVGMIPWERRTRKVKRYRPISSMLGVTIDNLDDYLESNGLTVAGFLKLLADQGVQPEWQEAEIEETYIDDPVYDYVSIFNFFPDPKKKHFDQLTYAFRRYHSSFEDIEKEHKDMGNIYQNMAEVAQLAKRKDKVSSGADATNYQDEIAQLFDSEDYTHKDDTDHQLEILEMWENDRLVKVVNRKVVIRDTGNPYYCGKIPFVFGKDIPIPNQFYGWGEIDPIKKIEDMMSDTTNMRLDNVVRSLLRMWLVNPNQLVDGEEFIPEPDNVIQVTDLNAVKPLDVPDVTAGSYKEFELWQRVIQNVTGVSDYATGMSDPSMNQTMGGVELLQQAANVRFKYKLQLFEKLLLEPIGYFYIEHDRQFISEERTFAITDQTFKVGPNNLRAAQGSFDLVVQSGSTEAVNQNTEIVKWADIMNRIQSGRPPFDGLTVEAYDEAAKRYYAARGISDSETLRKKARPIQPGLLTGQAAPVSQEGTVNQVQETNEEISPTA